MTPRAAVRWPVPAGLALLSVAGHLVVDAFTAAAPWTNNDNALILFIAKELAAGARLYVDWQAPDFPSTFFIALGVVRLTPPGIPIALVYNLLVLVLGVAGLALLVRSMRDRPRSAVVLAAGAYLLFLFRPGPLARDFGQREHLFALLFVAELFALAARPPPVWRPVWCAALGFAAMIKPHFLAMLVAAELFSPRRWRDLAWCLAGAAAPFALLWVHSPDSVRGFVGDTMHLHWSGAYALLDKSHTALLARGPLLVLASGVAAAALTAFAAARDPRLRALAGRWAVALLLAVFAVVHQQKYFPYHFVPLFGLAVVGAGWAAGELLARRAPTLAPLAAAALVLVGLATLHRDITRNGAPLPMRLAAAVRVSEPRILVASVYAHGLCTPHQGAPRCLGPELQNPRLALWSVADDAQVRLAAWARAVSARIERARPDLLVVSTGNAPVMPRRATPAVLLLEDFPFTLRDAYVPLSPAVLEQVGARNWVVLRRHDVRER